MLDRNTMASAQHLTHRASRFVNLSVRIVGWLRLLHLALITRGRCVLVAAFRFLTPQLVQQVQRNSAIRFVGFFAFVVCLITSTARADQVLLQDNFNRVNSTTLGSPWVQLNQVYSQYNSITGKQIGPSYTGISNNALGFTYTTPDVRATSQYSGGNGHDVVYAPLSEPVSSSATVNLTYTPNPDARSGYAIGLMNAATGFMNEGSADVPNPTPANGIFLQLDRSSYAYTNSSISISKFSNGNETTLASSPLPFQLIGGQTYDVGLSVSTNGSLSAAVGSGTSTSTLSTNVSGLPTLNQFAVANRSAGISFDTSGLTTQTALFDNLKVSQASRPTAAAILNHSVTVNLPFFWRSLTGQPAMITARFKPNLGFTLQEAAAALGFVNFDWIQTITAYPNPSGVYEVNTSNPSQPIHLTSASTPYNDPPPGGYTYCAKMGAPCDNAPFYYGIHYSSSDPLSLAAHETGNVLSFRDAPSDPCLAGPLGLPSVAWLTNRKACDNTTAPSGSSIHFTTDLAGVLSNGSAQDLGIGFSWTDSFNGTTGGIATTLSNASPDLGTGSGGITITSLNGASLAVPEPSSLLMLFTGLLLLGMASCLSRSARSSHASLPARMASTGSWRSRS